MYFTILTTIVATYGHIHDVWGIPLSIVVLYFSFRYLKNTLQKLLVEINNIFNYLQAGDIKSTQHLKQDSQDEFGSISTSANKLIDGFSNMEELQTTQEESTRRKSELNNELKAIYSSALIVNIDLSSSIINVNPNYSDLIGSSPTNMKGTKWQSYFKQEKEDNFDEILNTVQNGVIHKRVVTLYNGTEIRETYSLVMDESDFPVKIFVLGTSIY